MRQSTAYLFFLFLVDNACAFKKEIKTYQYLFFGHFFLCGLAKSKYRLEILLNEQNYSLTFALYRNMLSKISHVLSLTATSLQYSVPCIILLLLHWQGTLTLSPYMLFFITILCLIELMKVAHSISSRKYAITDNQATTINPFTRKNAVKSCSNKIKRSYK